MASSINKRYFTAIIAERGTTQRNLARDLGVNPSALSLVFSGRRRMRLDEAASIARLLGVPMSDVVENAGITAPPQNRVRLRGWVDATGEVHCLGEQGGVVDCPIPMPENSMAYQCRTAMSPLEYMDGWMLYMPPPVNGVAADALNKLALAKTVDGMGLLGYLKRGYERGRFSMYIGDRVVSDAAIDWAVPVKYIVTSN